MSAGSDSSRWSRAPATLWRRAADTVALLPPGAGAPVVAAGSSGVLWELLAEPVGLAELVSILAGAYGVEESAIAGDVASVLAQLREMGAVAELAER